ncbi:MAG TPA: hypothetical protein PKJ51_01475 [Methanothrix sp.]|nr:hypothetical protein [Methanothrix sp.]
MIYVVIGQSGSGKTTYVKRRWLVGPAAAQDRPLPHVVIGNTILVGKYGIGVRTEGTDTLSYSALPQILEFIRNNRASDIVIEGDRINNTRFFEYLRAHNLPAKLILVACSVDESVARLRAAGSKITPTFVRSTRTKSLRNFYKYRGMFDGEIVSTSAG